MTNAIQPTKVYIGRDGGSLALPMRDRKVGNGMRLFISSDIEGTAGIADWDETEPDRPGARWNYFREQMTREVAAACQGALDAGWTDILVKDAHDSGRNIIPTGLPRGVRLSRAWSGEALSMVAGLDQGFDALAFTGYHSAAHDSGNPLSHTMNGAIYEILINGLRASEFIIHSYAAGALGVPVIFLSGDKALCESAKAFVPGIVTVATSEGIGGATVGMHPLDAADSIRAAMKEAVSRGGKDCSVKMPDSFEIIIKYTQHAKALRNSNYPGTRRVDERTIEFKATDYSEVMRAFRFIL
ncbi:MAG: M55 family metallopeptidase [Oscillospiraceae bacterium]|nr:M55 family metallopeptidase [Oscillospiraceae bacterium]